MSACFGGVIRDILCNEIPVIFRKEIYATACIIGALVYFVMLQFVKDQNLIFAVSATTVITIRLAAVVFKIQLPSLYKKKAV
jgi:uncharacterized membrane protein YeiH